MVFKVVFFLALAVSQVAATLMHRSVVEFLSTRQTTGVCSSVCQIFQDALNAPGCTTTECICSISMITSLQACITCAVTSDPTAADEARKLIATYRVSCPSASLTIPSTASSTGATSGTLISSVGTTSAVLITPSTVSTLSTQPPLTRVTVGTSSTSSTDLATTTGAGDVPGLANTGSRSADVKRAGVVAVGAMIGAALVF